MTTRQPRLIRAARVRLVGGYRDHPPARREAICDMLLALSQMLAEAANFAVVDAAAMWSSPHNERFVTPRTSALVARPS